MTNRVQGGDDGGRSQDGDRRDLEQEESGGTQAAAMKATHSGADAGRSHGGGSSGAILSSVALSGTGSVVMGSGSPTEMGSGFCSGDGGLGSGSRVGLLKHPLDEGGEALSRTFSSTIEKWQGRTTALMWWHLV